MGVGDDEGVEEGDDVGEDVGDDVGAEVGDDGLIQNDFFIITNAISNFAFSFYFYLSFSLSH